MGSGVNRFAVLAGLISLVSSASVLAEPFGLLNGRSANVSLMPESSVEGGVVFGEFSNVDYEYFGARYNYKTNATTVAYGDLGQAKLSDVDEADGITFGIGAYFQMDGVLTDSDFGIHASVHRVKLEDDDNDEISGTSLVIEALFSGRDPINANGNMFWNGSLGLNRQSGEGESDTELTFSGGVQLKNAAQTGEFYAGVLYVDDLGFGAGFRHFLK